MKSHFKLQLVDSIAHVLTVSTHPIGCRDCRQSKTGSHYSIVKSLHLHAVLSSQKFQ